MEVMRLCAGQQRDSKHPLWDFAVVARHVAPYADYVVLNLASGKRRWFEENNLRALIKNVKVSNQEPFLKTKTFQRLL